MIITKKQGFGFSKHFIYFVLLKNNKSKGIIFKTHQINSKKHEKIIELKIAENSKSEYKNHIMFCLNKL
jgi:hypothetical protein